ncbi:uncharacterized protein LOC143888832 [Tasmannia lanceolata]|uniref:uncharacterized protein LOC143888832 n=1 Tax=Tasmannia lanceolata TaxID=3420 RepID=UPI0040639A7F
MEVYVDDMLVKSRSAQDHVSDLKETFQVLKKHSMKLNPTKCTFGVGSGKFLGFMVPRSAIKAQVLADFVAECTIPQQITEAGVVQAPSMEKSITTEECTAGGTETETISIPTRQDPSPSGPLWEVYVDGSSNKGGCGAGLILTGPDNFTADYALRFGFRASNNEAEYEALFAGMSLAIQTGTQKLKATENTKADVLSKLAASGYTTLGSICMEFLQKSSIESEAAQVMQVEHESCWMDEIIEYLRNGKLPEAKKKAPIQRAARFSLSDESLYKRSYTLPYLKCLRRGDAAYTLQETHEGICGEHLGGKALSIKVLLRDNGRQFDCKNFRKFYSDLKIEQRFTSVAHPQTNGQTEVTNRILLQGIKKTLDDKAGRWADELYHVLWVYRTTPRTPTGESPFNLSFEIEAVIPVDVGTPSPRVTSFNEQINCDGLHANLDLLEEAREES